VLELHGRDSVTINSGGEKIFAEEVEAALTHHPALYDVIVTGRPSERWGNEVVAIVQLRDGSSATTDELLAVCDGHIARYKFPKSIIVVDKIERSPAGKADYRWAQSLVASSED
jgi:fatty-acyl-CoA synthase